MSPIPLVGRVAGRVAGRAAALVLTLALGACAAPPQGLAADLPGTTWTLERVVGVDRTVQRGSGDAITFGPTGDLTVSSCNTCNGRYTLRGDVLQLASPLACTRRACAPGALELERALDGMLTVRREGEYLVIEVESATGTAQLLFLPSP